MSKAKYDPLEAAKLAADGGPAAPKTPAPTAPVAPAPEAAAPPVVKTTPSPAPMAPATAAAPSPTPKKIKFKVREARRVSVNGMIVDMKPGRVIDPAGYGGDAGMKRLRDQGLILDQFEE